MSRFFYALIFWLISASGIVIGAEGQTITFCAYNLRNYVRMERMVNGEKSAEQPKPEREINAVVRFIAEIKPDILGVCEIGSEEDIKDLQTRLKVAGVDLPNYESCHGGDPLRKLALLTRLPIIARGSQTELRYQIGEAVLPVQRGFLDCTIELRKGFPMRFIGAHLKSKRPIPENDQALMRRNEAHLLRRHVDSIMNRDPNTRLLLYGDLNDQKNEPSIGEIAGLRGSPNGLNELSLSDSRNERWTHYWNAADEYARIDYVMTSRPLNGYMDRASSYIYDPADYYEGSDHRPLVATIRLAKK
jgi:endonuclease/exonuclease/phosphatase family metal-dependent hydrolase